MPGRPRKLRLSPLEGELLWLLEEVGYEMPTIANSLGSTHAEAAREQYLWALQAAALKLYRLGFVRFYRDLGTPGLRCVSLTDDEVRQQPLVPESLRLNPDSGLYEWDVQRAGKFPIGLTLTTDGETALKT